MEYYESNFMYLKETKFNKYYKEIRKAEYICYEFPNITKMIIRKVLEEFLRDLAKEVGIYGDFSTGDLIKSIKGNMQLQLSQEIYNYIQIIRVNGVGITLYRSRNKHTDKHPVELLKCIHKIFYSQIKKIEPEIINKIGDLTFKIPRTVEFKERELKKIQENIILKNNQINSLREKIIELNVELKNITLLNRIIIEIKKEKYELEEIQYVLCKNIKQHKMEIEIVKEIYGKDTKVLDKLRNECIENHELLAQKESLLVKSELDNQRIRKSVKELDEKDSIIEKKVEKGDEELERLRRRYKKLLDLTNKYQDILESIEFTYDDGLKRKLNSDKIVVNTEINYEDKMFYGDFSNFNYYVVEAENKIRMFREILNDKIKRSIKNKEFYMSFLNIEGKQLRILYILIKSFNSSYTLINKPKDWFSKWTFSDAGFNYELNKNLEQLKNINDDQIKIILYYKLIKIADIPTANILNKKQFINALDSMVDVAYNMLMPQQEFNFLKSKLYSIKAYYLHKLLNELKIRYKNVKIQESNIHKIYMDIMKLNNENQKFVYEKVKVASVTESSIKNAIRKNPFEILSIIADIGDLDGYIDMYNTILEILKDLNRGTNLDGYDSQISLEKFLNGPFRIILFLSNGVLQLNKKEELLPLFISEILIGRLNYKTQQENLNVYNGMVEIWKRNQEKYNDIFIKKQEMQNKLNEIKKDKKSMINNILEDKKNKVSNSQNNLIINLNLNIEKLQKQLDRLKEFYPDMREDY